MLRLLRPGGGLVLVLMYAAGANVLEYEASNTPLFSDAEARCSFARQSAEDELINGGWTALTLAAHLGEDEVVAQLLEEGALPNVPDASGETALTRAIAGGHLDVVTQLLDGGALPFVVGTSMRTALNLASELGHTAIVRRLLNSSCTAYRDSTARLEPPVVHSVAVSQLLERAEAAEAAAEPHESGLTHEQAQALAIVQEDATVIRRITGEVDLSSHPVQLTAEMLQAARRLPSASTRGALVRGGPPSVVRRTALPRDAPRRGRLPLPLPLALARAHPTLRPLCLAPRSTAAAASLSSS